MATVGSAVVVGKLLVARVPVLLAGGLRLAFACVVLVPLLLAAERGWPRLSRRDFGVLTLQAFTGIFLFSVLLLGGLTRTSAAAAGIVTATTPAVAVALSALFLRERLTAARAGGIGLAVLGILALNLARPAEGAAAGASPRVGNLLVFGAVVGEALFIVCGKVAAARVPPLTAATLLSVLGFVMFLPFMLLELARFDLARLHPADWAALAYWGLVVTVAAFLLWARGLAVVPASTAAGFTAILPVSAVLLSYAWLGEPFRWAHVLGGACVIGGLGLLARERVSLLSFRVMALPDRVRAALTLTRFQAVVGITAGVFSIGATVGGILFATRPVHMNGEIVTIVQEARTSKLLANAMIEFRTPGDALVAILQAQNGQVRQTLREGPYRLRVSHPGFTTEVRQIQVLGGNSQEIRIRLAARPAPVVEKPPSKPPSTLDKAGAAIKKLFQ